MSRIGPLCAASAGAARVSANAQPARMGQGEPGATVALQTDATTHASARLLICAGEDDSAGRGILAGVRSWLRSLLSRGLRPNRREPTCLHVDDLEDRPLFASDDVRAPIDIRLPAGTYHVTVRLGQLHRRYTVTLQHGATFDLHLPLTKGRQ